MEASPTKDVPMPIRLCAGRFDVCYLTPYLRPRESAGAAQATPHSDSSLRGAREHSHSESEIELLTNHLRWHIRPPGAGCDPRRSGATGAWPAELAEERVVGGSSGRLLYDVSYSGAGVRGANLNDRPEAF